MNVCMYGRATNLSASDQAMASDYAVPVVNIFFHIKLAASSYRYVCMYVCMYTVGHKFMLMSRYRVCNLTGES